MIVFTLGWPNFYVGVQLLTERTSYLYIVKGRAGAEIHQARNGYITAIELQLLVYSASRPITLGR